MRDIFTFEILYMDCELTVILEGKNALSVQFNSSICTKLNVRETPHGS
jgi:hypothetical protein